MKLLANIAFMLLAFIAMEGVAWLSHKYIMHGFLWYLHRDHHEAKKGKLEKNDFFFLMYAIPSIILMATGINANFDWRFSIGLGIMLYGFSYFTLHEVFIHRRLKWFTNSSNKYLRAMKKAHLSHHKKKKNKKDYSGFGMLIFPRKHLSK